MRRPWPAQGPWLAALLLTLTSVVSVAALSATPVSAAGTEPAWHLQPTANVTGPQGELEGLSCARAKTCVAVGDYLNSSGTEATLAETWNGSSWIIRPTPNPEGAVASNLTAVSCSGPDACTAVGESADSNGTELTLAESWNGKSWQLRASPNPGGLGSYLSGVSCTAATACTAVGYYVKKAGSEVTAGVVATLGELWNGQRWSLEDTRNVPVGNTLFGVESVLSGVSCTTATACTAVGQYLSNTDLLMTLAEVRSGSSWKISSTPTPRGAEDASLAAVSCQATACTAVGYDESGSDIPVPLAETSTGGSWEIQAMANPKGSEGASVSGVSCTAGAACVAVGSYTDGGGAQLPLTEVRNGSRWAIQTTPRPGTARSASLSAVSSVTTTVCFTTGAYASHTGGPEATLVEERVGPSWRIQVSPDPAGARPGSLAAVSCTAASACLAVGDYTDSQGTVLSLAEAWNGTRWRILSTPNPAGAQASSLSGVSCTSRSACVAVGSYTDGGGTQAPLAESWNGSSWTMEATAALGKIEGGSLSGVSC
ncbi:MAG TPA: hypothetical protein VEH29_08380, partial [Acidimicrobiales bacterium]|nr:hypothetical protein [Acidimicrobiales bacterium]